MNKFIFLCLILLVPLAMAGTTFFDNQNDFFIMDDVVPTPVVTPVGGGGGGGVTLECINDSGCDLGEFCFENKCYVYECDSDLDCNDTKTCWMNRCVKLFDMKIMEVESPILPGDFFNFTYYLKGVAAIHGDVIIKFWLVQDENIVTEGFDTIYFADFEEKTETSELFLPATILPGVYNFYAEVEYDSYYARAGRVIEVQPREEIVPEGAPITGGVITQIGEGIGSNLLSILITAGIFILGIIIYWERKKLKRLIKREKRWIKHHKTSVLVGVLLVILAGIIIYLDSSGIISLPSLGESFVNLFNGLLFLIGKYWVFFVLLVLIILCVVYRRRIGKKLKLKKRIKSFENWKIKRHRNVLTKRSLIKKQKRANQILELEKIEHKEKFNENIKKYFGNLIEKINKKRKRFDSNRKKKQKEKALQFKQVQERKQKLELKKQKRERKIELKRQKLKLQKEENKKEIEKKKHREKLERIEKRKKNREKVKKYFRNIFIKMKKKKEKKRLLKREEEKKRKKQEKILRANMIKEAKKRKEILRLKGIEEKKKQERIERIKKKQDKLVQKKLLKLNKVKLEIKKIEDKKNKLDQKRLSIGFFYKIKKSIDKRRLLRKKREKEKLILKTQHEAEEFQEEKHKKKLLEIKRNRENLLKNQRNQEKRLMRERERREDLERKKKVEVRREIRKRKFLNLFKEKKQTPINREEKEDKQKSSENHFQKLLKKIRARSKKLELEEMQKSKEMFFNFVDEINGDKK